MAFELQNFMFFMRDKMKPRRFGAFLLSTLLTASFFFASADAQAQVSTKTSLNACHLLYQTQRTEESIQSLNVLAYNVENLFISTGKGQWESPGLMHKDSNQGPETKSPEKLAEIRKIILENNPDIMILTEVENIESLSVLASAQLQGLYRPMLIEGNDPRGIDIGFLVKSDLPWRFKLITHKELRWKNPQSGYEGPLFSRDLPVLEVYRTNSEQPLFVVIGNHAKSKRDMKDDPESRTWRSAQYVEAAKITKSYLEKKIPLLFAGDFNADILHDPEVQPLKNILQSSLAIAPDALPEKERITHTFHPRGDRPHFSQMDDIMVSPSLAPSVLSAQIVRYHNKDGSIKAIPQTYEQRSEQPSDHFPVLLKLSTSQIIK